jgi:hypothetical protein
MKTFLFCISITVLLFFFNSHAVAGEEPGAQNPLIQYNGNNSFDPNDVSGINPIRQKSVQQIQLEEQIRNLKNTDNESVRAQLSELNKQLGIISGNFETKPAGYNSGGIEPSRDIPFTYDNPIGNVRLYNNSTNFIKGLATYTEQRGANIGRIWVVYAFSANTSSPDSLRIVYSTNNGLTWVPYANAWLGGTSKINYDEIDAEIIENTTGDKYLWIVFGYRATGGTGRWQSGGLIMNISTFAGNFFTLAWPGDDAAKRYYRPRIVSDNAYWPSLAYTYIVCSFDSLNATNVRINTQKYARCTNPYTTTPTIAYQGQKFWWFQSGTAQNLIRDLHSDIAYFRNGANDSVIVSFSNVPDSTKIFFAKADISGNPPTGSVGAGGSIGGSQPNDRKQFARLSSNGFDNGSVVCVFRQFSGNNWNVKYFRTNNYGNFTTIAGQSILWGSSANTNYQPDIVGVRNANNHRFTFNTISTTDSVHHVNVTTAGGTHHIFNMNGTSLVSGVQGSKPAIRLVSGDTCMSIYAATGPYNVWAAYGCTGPITNISNNFIPVSYSLEQNYPNPFNPSTNIMYSISNSGLTRLVVYDILGKEISILVNEVKEPGSYLITFDATNVSSGVYFYKLSSGDFTQTRSMLILK